jgi:acetyl-CoA carboxylase biotin carboxylase subunit
MNTRLQVEHPVTELATSLDLVQWQLKIAAGEPLTVRQEDVRWTGSAIECRIYAEDPEQQFMPSPGKIVRLREPSGPGVRLDSGVYEGWKVPMDYDPLLAKLAVWAPSRELATERMKRALREYIVGGIRTNCEFFKDVLDDEEFRAGRLTTAFLDGFFERRNAKDRNATEPRESSSGDSTQPQTPTSGVSTEPRMSMSGQANLETEAVAALVAALAPKTETSASVKHEVVISKWAAGGRASQLR